MIFPLHFPNFNPILLETGFITIRWYSLAYIFGILITNFIIKKANQKDNFLSKEAYDNWIIWAVLSILLGGRLGYVLFYDPIKFLNDPLEIFATWHGGMSFHGGLLGAILGMYIFCKKYKIEFLKLTDVLALAAPIGIFLGRLANFINMELYGRFTNSNYGMIFPGTKDLPRHPSQLYEAFFEGIVIFIVIFVLKKRLNQTQKNQKNGLLSSVFLILYGSFRIILENFREPDQQIGFIFNYLTMGQILSLPLIIVGIFVFRSYQRNKL
jgi:phosphatidylglycerol:prolipoprotein diacylglycerol transferase